MNRWSWSIWSGVFKYALIGVMTINIAGTAWYLVQRNQLRGLQKPPASVEGSKFPAFAGVDLKGVKWQPQDAPCRVVRITDDDCVYCMKDKPAYTTILDAARAASCEIIEMSPRAGRMAEDKRPGVVQLKFVDTNIAPAIFPFATPQTLILNRDWVVDWSRRGILDEKALALGLSALRATR